MNKVVIFDLDGTLIDTSEGIFNSVRYAEKKMQLKPIDESRLREFVGPPPKDMYKTIYNLTENEALQAAKYHREYGGLNGFKESVTYDGIVEVLNTLKRRDYILTVGTLKKQAIAEDVLELHQLATYFDMIVGMDSLESYTKPIIIKQIMEQFNLNNSDTCMIGDTLYDYYGAMEAKVKFVGVLYGFGLSCENKYDFPCITNPKKIHKLIEKIFRE